MQSITAVRTVAVRLAACAVFVCLFSASLFAMPPQGDHKQPAPHRNQAPPPSRPQPVAPQGRQQPNNNPQFLGGRNHDEHFSQWMDRRSNLTPEQQQRELQREPGFRQLPRDQQMKLQDRLQKLNQMPPDQRQRMLQRNEAIEHMSPNQRRNFRDAMQRWTTMDPERRRAIAQSFRNLRNMPPDQRAAALNSQAYRSRLTDEERSTLSTILEAEPAPSQPPISAQH